MYRFSENLLLRFLLLVFRHEQNGFRKIRSCNDHIFTLNSLIKMSVQTQKSVCAAFVDLEKAFDRVNQDLLFYKLLRNNINGKIYKAIKLLYTNTLSCVTVNSLFTQWFEIHNGVRQGDTLSPTLFIFFINDLVSHLKDLNLGIDVDGEKICILLYADDFVLLANSEQDLQSLLNATYTWCNKWHLKLNTTKTKVIHFREKRKRQTSSQFIYGRHKIDIVTSYKYLGVIFDEFMEFNECAKTLSDSGGRALGALISRFKEFRDLGFKAFMTLLNSGVQPILTYGSSVWGMKSYKDIDKIYNRACRYYLGTHKFTPISAMYGEMGFLPAIFHRQVNALRLWNRILGMSPERLTRKVLLLDCQSSVGWSKDIKLLFECINMGDLFTKLSKCDINQAIIKLKQYHGDNWIDVVNNKPKLRTYKKFKTSLDPANCLTWNLQKSERSLFAQFRCGILQLRVESGRFCNLELGQRICQMCDNAIEDEFHFLCICPIYLNLRENLYSSYYNISNDFIDLSDDQKFVYMLKQPIRNLIKYVTLAWNLRKLK